jgi:hypothetical protein
MKKFSLTSSTLTKLKQITLKQQDISRTSAESKSKPPKENLTSSALLKVILIVTRHPTPSITPRNLPNRSKIQHSLSAQSS